MSCSLSSLESWGWNSRVDAVFMRCFLSTSGMSPCKEAAQCMSSSCASFSENCLQLQGRMIAALLEYVIQGSLTAAMGPGIDPWPKVWQIVFSKDGHSSLFHQHAFLTMKPCYTLFRQWSLCPLPLNLGRTWWLRVCTVWLLRLYHMRWWYSFYLAHSLHISPLPTPSLPLPISRYLLWEPSCHVVRKPRPHEGDASKGSSS